MDYFSRSQLSSLSINDKTYDKIINHLDEFIKSLPENDKHTLLQVINKSYLKYQNSITTLVTMAPTVAVAIPRRCSMVLV